MLHEHNMYNYQSGMSFHQMTNPYSMVWAEMGLGKTVATLTSIKTLIDCGFLRGVLVVAPIRVCRLVWRKEAVKWSHLQHLTFSMVTGTAQKRLRSLLDIDKNIYLINYENLAWLSTVLQDYFINRGRPIPFDGIVWDEITKMKNSTSKRAKHFKKIMHHFKWRTGLTGSPASNGYKDLHGQYLVIDDGWRLGQGKTKFMAKYYWTDHHTHKVVAFPNSENEIKQAISDITIEMSAADFNPLPDMMINDIEITLEGKIGEDYDRLEKDFFLQLDSGKEIEMFNKASLLNKLLQYGNGAVYVEPGKPEYEIIHDEKLDALEEVIEAANGKQVLCAYSYKSDAQRIMKKFKHLRPVNLTECKSEKALKNAMDRWQSGDCPLMIGHPACLHSSTEVLTERNGWVKIINVEKDDKVFDGVEFVSHDGCQFSGYKKTIDVFGITMTPDHKLLIDGEWVEGQNVRDCKRVKGKALYEYQGNDSGISEMFGMRSSIQNVETKCTKTQSTTKKVLSKLLGRKLSPNDRHTNLENMVWNDTTCERSARQELWWSWNNCLRRMEGFSKLLQGYVGRLFGRSYIGKKRCEWGLLSTKLHMGNTFSTTRKQTEQSLFGVQRRNNTFGRIMSKIGLQQDDVNNETQQGNDSRRSGRGCSEIYLRQEFETSECIEKTKAVYDLVNCGPRHRFLIRNSEGEMFISHNSMGHGIDGLQDGGNILVWYGLTWSLDLYDQFNARIRRQGQGLPVICHRIWGSTLADALQAAALADKSFTEESLKRAVKEYRSRKGL
jgi:hypothetical protein